MTDQLIQGITLSDLAQTYGTPLYVYDGDVLRSQYLGLREALSPDVEMLLLAEGQSQRRGVRRAVPAWRRSGGVVAGRAGHRGHGGRARRADDLPRPGQERRGAGRLPGRVASRWSSASRSASSTCSTRWRASAAPGRRSLLRVNPAFSVKGSRLTMGGKPRQFGIDEDQLLADAGLLSRWPSLTVTGVHAYLGTRILDEAVVAVNTERILDLAERVSTRLGFGLETVDIGGGLGVAYFDGERDIAVETLTAQLNPVFGAFRRRHPQTRIVMELGRYLTALAAPTWSGCGTSRPRWERGSRSPMAAPTITWPRSGIGSFVKRNFPVSAAQPDR